MLEISETSENRKELQPNRGIMKILLTGATGFLGSHIAESLTQDAHEVRCLVRATSDITFLKTLKSVEILEGSLSNLDFLQKAVMGVDAIIHNAGLTGAIHSQDYFTANVETSMNLMMSAKHYTPHLKRFIYISSLAAAGPRTNNQPQLTDNPVSHYGRSKLMAEMKLREHANEIPLTILRPPVIYGPRDKNMLILFQAIKKGIAVLFLQGQMQVNTIYVKDVVSAVTQALMTPTKSGNTYFINDGQSYLWRELISQLAQTVSRDKHININIPLFLMKSIAFLGEYYAGFTNKKPWLFKDKIDDLCQLNWLCDDSETRRDLNWSPKYDWITGTQETYNWYREMGWLI